MAEQPTFETTNKLGNLPRLPIAGQLSCKKAISEAIQPRTLSRILNAVWPAV
jgi:hypothetical protein